MKILTIDTSSNCSSVALSDGAPLLGECILGEDRCNSGRLLDSISNLLAAAGLTPDGLDAFAVSLGPGSFTGVRVGIATVKGLAIAAAQARGRILLARHARHEPPVQLRPGRRDVRRQKERGLRGPLPLRLASRAVSPDAVVPPAQFLAAIDRPTLFVGEGALRYRDLIRSTLGDLALFPPWHANLPRASAGAVIALDAALKGNFTPLAPA